MRGCSLRAWEGCHQARGRSDIAVSAQEAAQGAPLGKPNPPPARGWPGANVTAPVQCPLGCCSAGQLSVLQGRDFLSSSHSSSPQPSRKKTHPGDNQAAESCHGARGEGAELGSSRRGPSSASADPIHWETAQLHGTTAGSCPKAALAHTAAHKPTEEPRQHRDPWRSVLIHPGAEQSPGEPSGRSWMSVCTPQRS